MDFRRFLKRLEEVEELKTIPDETHWSLEAAALCAMTNRVGGPAIFFPKVKGYPPGYGLAGSLLTGPGTMFYQERTPWGRIAVALGLDKGVSYEALMEVMIERRLHPIPPLRVSTGPCKEVITRDREADLFSLPFPYLYGGDGGRYGTCQILIVKDPEMDWVNWGVYRFMLLTQDRLAIHMGPRSHIGAIYRKYERRGEPMPCCIALGGPPTIILTATLPIPVGESEVDWVGGLEQELVELVRAETNDLLVPANAEIIIEGEVRPHERWDEGPFGEYDGFMNAPRMPRPGYVREVACYFYSMGMAAWFNKLVMVDPYVNPIDMDEVLEEIVLKMHSRRGYRVSDIIAPIAQVAAYASDEEKKRGYDSSAIFDATSPYSPDGQLRELISLENLYSQETLAWLKEKWKVYGFQEKLEFKGKGNGMEI